MLLRGATGGPGDGGRGGAGFRDRGGGAGGHANEVEIQIGAQWQAA